MDDSHETEEASRIGGETPLTVSPKLLHDVQLLVSRLAEKSHQLIGNNTTNLAEALMHKRCKFDGGTVINRSQSGSWQNRCMGAGLEQNHGSMWGPKAWNNMTGDAPYAIFSEVSKSTAMEVEKQRKRKATEFQRKHKGKAYMLVQTIHLQQSKLTGTITVRLVEDVSEKRLIELKDSY